jgi:hypothetical protein
VLTPAGTDSKIKHRCPQAFQAGRQPGRVDHNWSGRCAYIGRILCSAIETAVPAGCPVVAPGGHSSWAPGCRRSATTVWLRLRRRLRSKIPVGTDPVKGFRRWQTVRCYSPLAYDSIRLYSLSKARIPQLESGWWAGRRLHNFAGK